MLGGPGSFYWQGEHTQECGRIWGLREYPPIKSLSEQTKKESVQYLVSLKETEVFQKSEVGVTP